jgi:hypothetical protein
MKNILSILLLVLLMGCQKEQPKQDDYTWQIFVKDFLVLDQLVTEKTITQCDGSSDKVTYSNTASSGNTFILINVEINKAKSGSSSFSWDEVYLIDQEGNSYLRINDLFLDQHDYDRLSGIDLRLGNNTGWIAFEISDDSSKQNLSLVHEADEGDNKVPVSK